VHRRDAGHACLLFFTGSNALHQVAIETLKKQMYEARELCGKALVEKEELQYQLHFYEENKILLQFYTQQSRLNE